MRKRMSVSSYLNNNNNYRFFREEEENTIWITNNLTPLAILKLYEAQKNGDIQGSIRIANDFAVDVEALAHTDAEYWLNNLAQGANDAYNAKDFESLGATFGSGVGTIDSGFSMAGERAKELGSDALNAAKELGSDALNTASDAWNTVKDNAASFGKGFSQYTRGYGATAKDYAEKFSDNVSKLTEKKSQSILEKTMDMLKEFMHSIGSGFSWIWETISGAFIKAGEYLGSLIRNLFGMENSPAMDRDADYEELNNQSNFATKNLGIDSLRARGIRDKYESDVQAAGPFTLENCISYALAAAAISIIALVVYKVIKWVKSKKSQNVNNVEEMYILKFSEINRLQETTFYFLKNNLQESSVDGVQDELENMIQDNIELEQELQNNSDDSIMGKIKAFLSKYFTWILGIILLGGIGALLYINSDSLPDSIKDLFEKVRIFFGGKSPNSDKYMNAYNGLKNGDKVVTPEDYGFTNNGNGNIDNYPGLDSQDRLTSYKDDLNNSNLQNKWNNVMNRSTNPEFYDDGLNRFDKTIDNNITSPIERKYRTGNL